jgi:hypothetical protein
VSHCFLALHIRSFVRSFVRVFACLFGFVRSFVVVLVLISLSTTMEYVLTLGELLFACVACSFVRSLVLVLVMVMVVQCWC